MHVMQPHTDTYTSVYKTYVTFSECVSPPQNINCLLFDEIDKLVVLLYFMTQTLYTTNLVRI